MTIRKDFITIHFAVLFIIAIGMVAPDNLYAGAKEVTIRVDGLACPFCAYGVEKKLKRLDGVEKVKILINEGKITFTIKDGVPISRKEIERAVNEGGFTPRKIDIGEK